MGGNRLVHRTLDQGITVIGRPDQPCRRHFHILEMDFGGAQTIDRGIIAGGDALGILVHQEHADAFLIALIAGGARGHDQRVGDGGAQHHSLAAVQHVIAALLLRRGRNIGQIEARLRLGKGKRHDGFAGRDLVEEFLLQRIGARARQKPAADHHRRHIGFDHQCAAELLHDHHGIDRAAAEPAIGFRQGGRKQPKLGKLGPVFGIAPRFGAGEFAPVLVSIIVGQIFRDRIAEQRLLFAEIEIHCPFTLRGNASGPHSAKSRARADPSTIVKGLEPPWR